MIKYLCMLSVISIRRVGVVFFVISILITAGCAYRLQPDPLKGWKGLGTAYVVSCPFGKVVIDDYQDYIQNLPASERKLVHNNDIEFYEFDRERAVEIRFQSAAS